MKFLQRWFTRRRMSEGDIAEIRWAAVCRTREERAEEFSKILAEVAHLNDALNEARANIDEMQKEHEAAILRLTDPKLDHIHMEPGGVLEMGIEPCLGAKIIAGCFAELIGKAPNWASFEVGPFDTFEGQLLVTVRRRSGESPEFQVGELKKEIERLTQANLNYQEVENTLATKVAELEEEIRQHHEVRKLYDDTIAAAQASHRETLAKVANLEEALAVEHDEAVKQFGIADDYQDRVASLNVELTLAIETIRKMRDACILSRIGLRSLPPVFAGQNKVEIRSCDNAIEAADRFLSVHKTPENATR